MNNSDKNIIPQSDFAIEPYPNNSEVAVVYYDKNLWMTQKDMANMFDTTVQNVGKHISNLEQSANKNFLNHKFKKSTGGRIPDYYPLHCILYVGFNTLTTSAIEFQEWATEIIRKYSIKGVAVNPHLADKDPDLVTDHFYEQISPSMKRRFNKHGHTQAYQIERQQSVEERKLLSGQIVRTTDGKPNFGAIMGLFHISLTGKTKAELLKSYEHAVNQTSAIDTLGSVVVRHINILMESVRMVLESYPDNAIPSRQHVLEIKQLVNQFSEHSRAQLELLSQKTGIPVERLGENSHKRRLL